MNDAASELFAAVRARNREKVREILARHPEWVAARDADGATPLHYATEIGDRQIVTMLLDAGADINARDLRFNATPAGWAIEYLRPCGALLGMEIEDARRAIAKGDVDLVRHYVTRLPALREAVAADARSCGNEQIARLFGLATKSSA